MLMFTSGSHPSHQFLLMMQKCLYQILPSPGATAGFVQQCEPSRRVEWYNSYFSQGLWRILQVGIVFANAPRCGARQ